MNIVASNTSGAIAAYVAGRRSFNDELSAGVTGGFAVVGYKGKIWRVKSQGNETMITRDDVVGDGSKDPAASIEVVIVKSSPVITKTYYIKGWEDGANAPPDCFSSNGITPDANAPHKQNGICKTCKHDAFGSRAQEGSKGKACQDNRRIAVVPAKDIDNEALGGPMLLRVPPASLKELLNHGLKLDQKGLPYFGVVTRVSFDPNSIFKLLFTPVRTLNDDEFAKVLALRDDTRVMRILAENVSPDAIANHPPEQAKETASDDPYDNLGPTPAGAKAVTSEVTELAAPKPEPKPEPKPAPEPAPEPEDDAVEAAALKALEAVRAAKKAKAEAAKKAVAKADKKDEAPKPTVAAPAAFDAHLDQMLNDLP
jgi:hypothetical protein